MSPYAHSETPSNPSLTPQSTHLATFSPKSPTLETPVIEHQHPLGLGHSQLTHDDREDIEELLDLDVGVGGSYQDEAGDVYDTKSLTSNDVHHDPILSDLASKQSQSQSNTPFKARPAPSSTSRQGLGPRMTKSAALRAGLDWEEIKPRRTASEKEGEEGLGMPGYKRVGLGITVPSLAQPSITPRQTKSSQLRLKSEIAPSSSPSIHSQRPANGIIQSTPIREHKRTLSVPTPVSSLCAPTILPRQNRTSALRAAGEKGNAGYRDYEKLQQEKAAQKIKEQIALDNRERAKKEREERRKTLALGLISLEKPAVEVKQNRTSQLRAAGEKGNEGYRNFEKIQEERDAAKLKEQVALENREKAKKERMERRKTLAFAGAGSGWKNEPEIQVRQNTASALRAAGEKGSEGYRDIEVVRAERKGREEMERLARENKERGRREREERRKTLSGLVGGRGKPVITPRPNKTSLLRTNSSKSISSISSLRSPVKSTHSRSTTSHSLTRTISALKVSSADNVSVEPKGAGAGAGVKSLGKPSITPRLNKTALLRTPKPTSTPTSSSRPVLPTSSSTPTIHRKAASVSTPLSKGPRPTKASMLRANLANKVPTAS
ncbi:hypothetical protein I302_100282 [Kwoniella bestiolae CBS 10118]|uniref:Uncharacterized protein n=1 Tax=Kwoniella bestiolae CBS 10118 TaxID=1296100 RepID=A0A1B9G4K7_9TREE|nr:hypothetical protein I302_03654 [Kwoniella bestiolae CBS 10118]OCF25977.1 hypothetical protein I302_03654 [Kwoniella bestiolae CBS 10118]